MSIRIRRFKPPNPLDIGFFATNIEPGGPIPDDGGQLGKLVITPAYYLHTLEALPGTIRPREIVDALTFYAHGFALHARDHALPGSFAPSEILFHVSPDNAKMRAYVESKGATAESAILYRLPL